MAIQRHTINYQAASAALAFIMSVVPAALAQNNGAGLVSESVLRESVQKFRNFVPKDQFTAAPDFATLNGRDFQVDIPLRPSGAPNQICTGTPFYGYSTEKNTLRIVYDDGESSVESVATALRPLPRFTFDCEVGHTKEMAGNAFGAVREINVTHELYNALEASNLPGAFVPRYLDFSMNGNSARDLVKVLRLRVTGTIEQWGDGTMIKCENRSSPATIQMPEETDKDFCAIKAHITRVELINISNGSVFSNVPFNN